MTNPAMSLAELVEKGPMSICCAQGRAHARGQPGRNARSRSTPRRSPFSGGPRRHRRTRRRRPREFASSPSITLAPGRHCARGRAPARRPRRRLPRRAHSSGCRRATTRIRLARRRHAPEASARFVLTVGDTPRLDETIGEIGARQGVPRAGFGEVAPPRPWERLPIGGEHVVVDAELRGDEKHVIDQGCEQLQLLV